MSSDSVDGLFDCLKKNKDEERLIEDSTNGAEVISPNEKYATHYKMDHKKNGLALIFGFEKFKKSSELDRSNGNDTDVANLKKTLNNLDIEYLVFSNLKKKEIEDHLRSAAKRDYSEYNCLFVFVLSHGQKDYFLASDKKCDISMIWNAFTPNKCPTLADKPKLFFFQCCSGNKYDNGIDINFHPTVESDGETESMPLYSDILIGRASFLGHFAFRRSSGSWYIKSLCDVLNSKAYDYHILDLLVFVNQQVALDFQSCSDKDEHQNNKKQTPVVIHTFKRFMQFQRLRLI